MKPPFLRTARRRVTPSPLVFYDIGAAAPAHSSYERGFHRSALTASTSEGDSEQIFSPHRYLPPRAKRNPCPILLAGVEESTTALLRSETHLCDPASPPLLRKFVRISPKDIRLQPFPEG